MGLGEEAVGVWPMIQVPGSSYSIVFSSPKL
jgi:hypothetical protein